MAVSSLNTASRLAAMTARMTKAIAPGMKKVVPLNSVMTIATTTSNTVAATKA